MRKGGAPESTSGAVKNMTEVQFQCWFPDSEDALPKDVVNISFKLDPLLC